MIAASAARQIANESDASVDAYLDWLDSRIRERAEAGLTQYMCCLDDKTSKTICTTKFEPVPKPNVFQDRVITKLRQLGYRAEWKATSEPRSGKVIDDDDREVMYQTFTIIINW
jgi:hypothetical protein